MTGFRPQFRERVGTTLAEKYTLRNLLGVGGMAAVFEAENTWTGRRVAIKLLTADTDGDDEKAARFMQEARAATRVEHPNIVQVLDMGRDAEDGSLFIVEEYLTGQDLRALLDTRHKLPVRTSLEIMIPVMDALHAAHAQGVVHRDIKPANIFLARAASGDIFPKVIDFGVVKLASSEGLTKTGTTIGTPEYMSPEQAHGDRSIDQQTDVWSTAVVLWEMLAGQCPYQNENYHALLVKIIWEPTPRIERVVPNLPEGFADILHRALERDRKERYPDMRAFLDAVLACPGLAKEPWMQALGNAYGKRVTPGLHEVTGFIAMPNRPAAQISVSIDLSDLPAFAPPEAPTIELEAIDVSSSSSEHVAAPSTEHSSLTPPPSSSPARRPVNKSVVAFVALGVACLLGAALALRTGPAPAPASRPANAPPVAVAAPPAPPPSALHAPTPPTPPPAAIVAAPPSPVHPPAPAPVAIAPEANPDEPPAPDLVFAPSPEPHRARPRHVPPPPPPPTHRSAHQTTPTRHPPPPPPPPVHRTTPAHRTRNGAPILSVP